MSSTSLGFKCAMFFFLQWARVLLCFLPFPFLKHSFPLPLGTKAAPDREGPSWSQELRITQCNPVDLHRSLCRFALKIQTMTVTMRIGDSIRFTMIIVPNFTVSSRRDGHWTCARLVPRFDKAAVESPCEQQKRPFVNPRDISKNNQERTNNACTCSFCKHVPYPFIIYNIQRLFGFAFSSNWQKLIHCIPLPFIPLGSAGSPSLPNLGVPLQCQGWASRAGCCT